MHVCVCVVRTVRAWPPVSRWMCPQLLLLSQIAAAEDAAHSSEDSYNLLKDSVCDVATHRHISIR